MFKRLCRAETTEIYKSADDMLEGWFGFSRTASKNIVKAFEFNPKDFLYYRSRAITADVPNSNGDCFKKEELAKAYQSFIGKGVFYEHASDNPDNSFGIILDSNFVQPAGKNAYIEILCAVDRKLAEEKYPGLVHRVESGMLSGTSMGCFLKGTPILTGYDDQIKAIEEIKIGDLVLTHKGSHKQVTETFVRAYNGDLITITVDGLDGTTLTMTEEHPVYTKSFTNEDNFWLPVKHLKVGDIVFTPIRVVSKPNLIQFMERKIIKISKSHYEGPVYNFEVEDDHSYIAGDIAVHNCLAGAAECGICGNYTTTLEGLCEHMNPDSMGYVKGKLINASTNEYGFEYNYNITFIEDSLVSCPADATAQIFEVFAAAKDKLDPKNPNKELIATLIQSLQTMQKMIR
jgi:hypothetical protein